MAKNKINKVIKMSNARRRRGFKLEPDNRKMIIAAIIAVILGLWLAFRPNAYEISINGEVVGAIKELKVIEAAKETVITQLKSEYKSDVKFEDDLELRRYRAGKRDYIDPTYLISNIRNNMEILVGFKELYVEDESIGIITSEEELETLKNELKKKYYGEKEVKVEFGKKVELKDTFAKEKDLISMEKLVQKCSLTTPKSINYEIQSGDTLYGIASKYNTTVDSIIAANPEFSDKVVLKIGQIIKVNVNEPLLPLNIIKEESPVEETPVEESKEG